MNIYFAAGTITGLSMPSFSLIILAYLTNITPKH